MCINHLTVGHWGARSPGDGGIGVPAFVRQLFADDLLPERLSILAVDGDDDELLDELGLQVATRAGLRALRRSRFRWRLLLRRRAFVGRHGGQDENGVAPHDGRGRSLAGYSTFHLMFLSAAHSMGGSPAGATPLASGPRHCGQFSLPSATGFAATTAMVIATVMKTMRVILIIAVDSLRL